MISLKNKLIDLISDNIINNKYNYSLIDQLDTLSYNFLFNKIYSYDILLHKKKFSDCLIEIKLKLCNLVDIDYPNFSNNFNFIVTLYFDNYREIFFEPDDYLRTNNIALLYQKLIK